mgnify:CR=1 FL=1
MPDVSELVTAGDNAICVKLGDGMYRVPGGRYVYFPRSYGDRKLLATLRIIYEDGRTQEISTGDDWKIGESPILFCCIYGVLAARITMAALIGKHTECQMQTAVTGQR